ncbi:type II toxin-antitoxin system VapC family toxin [Desulfurobacterium sp.]
MGNVILDSNVIIYLSKGIIDIADLIRSEEVKIWISIISYMEVLSFDFLSFEEEKFVRDLLQEFFIIEINREIAERTIQIRRKYKIKLPDAIICASASVTDAILITADTRLGKVREANVKVISPPTK